MGIIEDRREIIRESVKKFILKKLGMETKVVVQKKSEGSSSKVRK